MERYLGGDKGEERRAEIEAGKTGNHEGERKVMRAYSMVRAGRNEGDEGRLGGGLIQPLCADRRRELHTKEAVLLGVMKYSGVRLPQPT